MHANANFRGGRFSRLLLIAVSLFFILPLALRAQNADDVINAYIKARGGLAKLKSVQT